MADEAPFRAERLTKRFHDVTALADLDLEVERGEVLGYLGPNGAGKSTTVRIALGLMAPTAGRCSLFGLDSRRAAAEAHRRVAYVPGEAALWPGLTGDETLVFFEHLRGGVDRRYRDELVERFHFDPSRKVRTYSKGNRQKLVLIAALMTRAELLLLDEPTSGLDPLMEIAFRDSIHEAKANGQTVFLSSHILSEVEALSDRVAILRAGRLIDVGTLDQLRHLAALSVEATFRETVPDLGAVTGVRDVSVSGRTLRCQVHGELDDFVKAVGGHHLLHLIVREPSLEDLFLAHYGGAADGG